MNHWMFRCQDVSQKISQSMDGPLPLLQRLAIRIHLMMCRYCARFLLQLMTLRRLCRAEAPAAPDEETPEPLSEAAKTRIKEKLRSLH
jgi:predicted anti-sigma-YlaC factor YlaD